MLATVPFFAPTATEAAEKREKGRAFAEWNE